MYNLTALFVILTSLYWFWSEKGTRIVLNFRRKPLLNCLVLIPVCFVEVYRYKNVLDVMSVLCWCCLSYTSMHGTVSIGDVQ